MSIKTLHKCLFSFTQIVSLVSFQGYVKPVTQTIPLTEWIVSEQLSSVASVYYLCFTSLLFPHYKEIISLVLIVPLAIGEFFLIKTIKLGYSINPICLKYE